MLFKYKPIKHSIQEFQLCIEHTVLSVWCCPIGRFSQTKLHSKLRPLVEEVKNNNNDYLYIPIKTIYNIFKDKLNSAEIKIIKRGFKANNAIKKLCEGKGTPLLYNDIEAINRDLANEIKSFFNNLYTEVFKLQSFKNHFGDIHEHYRSFVRKNDTGVCPFCGITDLKSENLPYVDAYDHYLSKGKYPFSSVNFKNLFPMCHECNSYNKHGKDIIHQTGTTTRQKGFYPYSSFIDDLNIKITLKSKVYTKWKVSDFDLIINSANYPEESKTWSEVFGLVTRYKDLCVKNKHGKTWISMILQEGENYEKTAKEMYTIALKTKSKDILFEQNFIQIPLLKACDEIGLFDLQQ